MRSPSSARSLPPINHPRAVISCLIFSCLQALCWWAKNNNNSHDNVYGAVIMTKVIARVQPVHLMNVDWAPGGRQPSDQVSRLTLETSDFVHGSAMWSLSLVTSECSLSGRGQGHASNFHIVDLEDFATASRRYTGTRPWSVSLWHLWNNASDSIAPWLSAHAYYTLPPTKPPTS